MRNMEISLDGLGELPTPKYLSVENTCGIVPWIGIELPGDGGKTTRYLTWRLFRIDLNNIDGSKDIARQVEAFVSSFKHGITIEDVELGLPVDIGSCSSETGHIELNRDRRTLGLYVEENKIDQAAMYSKMPSY